MSRHLRLVLAFFLPALVILPSAAMDAGMSPITAQGTLQAAFPPWDDAEALVAEAIEKANRQILVQAYLLTSRKIAGTLVSAKRRGIDVQVLADARQGDGKEASRIPALVNAGIPVWLETRYQNAHNKIIIIDAGTPQAIVITGSFNFTWSAQHKNAENVLIARNNPSLASRYALNWERHRREAEPFKK